MRQRQFSTPSPLLNVMIQAVYSVAPMASRDYGEVTNLQVSMKGPGDFVTNTDKRIEKKLFDLLAKARPGYSFLMEESGEVKGKNEEFRWIIDPIDGTVNFMKGLPCFSVSIALEKQGEVIAGVTYDTLRDELFYAEKGFGAFLNGRRIRVGNVQRLEDALMGVALPNARCHVNPERLSILQHVGPRVMALRAMGSTTLALAYVAAGRLNAFSVLNPKLWDTAAGEILIKEAGGYVSLIVKESKLMVASSPVIHAALKTILQKTIS